MDARRERYCKWLSISPKNLGEKCPAARASSCATTTGKRSATSIMRMSRADEPSISQGGKKRRCGIGYTYRTNPCDHPPVAAWCTGPGGWSQLPAGAAMTLRLIANAIPSNEGCCAR